MLPLAHLLHPEERAIAIDGRNARLASSQGGQWSGGISARENHSGGYLKGMPSWLLNTVDHGMPLQRRRGILTPRSHRTGMTRSSSEDKKPEGYDDIPKEIIYPDVTKHEDWDEEEYGKWTAPTIPNVDYKGPWTQKVLEATYWVGAFVWRASARGYILLEGAHFTLGQPTPRRN